MEVPYLMLIGVIAFIALLVWNSGRHAGQRQAMARVQAQVEALQQELQGMEPSSRRQWSGDDIFWVVIFLILAGAIIVIR